MKRVLVATPDLLWRSQVEGVAARAGWTALALAGDAPRLPPGDLRGDILVLDLTRSPESAWALLQEVKDGRCPWDVLACFAHVDPQIRDEALRRGVRQAWPRSVFLQRLAEALARSPPNMGHPAEHG